MGADALVINSDFVAEWSTRYLEEISSAKRYQEDRLFAEVGPQIRGRGFLELEDLIAIVDWKAPRARPRVEGNSFSLVVDVSRWCFEIGDERVLTLTSLAGVGIPIASAILAVWNPDQYTVTDWRSVSSLQRSTLGAKLTTKDDYGLYLRICRQVASSLSLTNPNVSVLRSLDRALWKYSAVTSSHDPQ